MITSRPAAIAVAIVLFASACQDVPTEAPAPSLSVAGQGPIVVATLAQWQQAITGAKNNDRIVVQGTIQIPGGAAPFLAARKVTIEASWGGSGLRGIANALGDGPRCLICLEPSADGTSIVGLTLDGLLLNDPNPSALVAVGGADNDPLVGVTVRSVNAVCDAPCDMHVLFDNAPRSVFVDNTLIGMPSFVAIQVQDRSHRTHIVDNWIEHAGTRAVGGIRVVISDRAFVADNTIATTSGPGIVTSVANGGTFKDNVIVAITDPTAPSCRDNTLGTGSFGTANTWVDNQAPLPSDPVGICGPSP